MLNVAYQVSKYFKSTEKVLENVRMMKMIKYAYKYIKTCFKNI